MLYTLFSLSVVIWNVCIFSQDFDIIANEVNFNDFRGLKQLNKTSWRKIVDRLANIERQKQAVWVGNLGKTPSWSVNIWQPGDETQ